MNQKYITIEEGEDYRTIAAKMTTLGYKMNHATARNILLSGMYKFMQHMSESLGKQLTEEECTTLVMRQDIHEVLGDILPLCAVEETISCPVVK
jgi:hypothetical protein